MKKKIPVAIPRVKLKSFSVLDSAHGHQYYEAAPLKSVRSNQSYGKLKF